jgi:hypothetical protein
MSIVQRLREFVRRLRARIARGSDDENPYNYPLF